MTVLPDDGLSLAAEFPEATHEQWQRLVAGVLRKSGKEVSGAAAEDALSTLLEDGLSTRPLYTARDGAPDPGLPGFAPFVRGGTAAGGTSGGWDVRQRHATADNAAVLADLENGVTSLWLVVGAESGIPVSGLAGVLEGVYLDLAPVALDAGPEVAAAARELLRISAEGRVLPAALRGTLGADPLGREARTGEPGDLTEIAGLLRLTEGSGLRPVTVDALPYHEAGGSAAQELGASLATGVAYLRELTGAGLGAAEAAARLDFRYAATADQFLTIAKLRAARRLWARVTEVCGAPSPQRQHVVTSSVMSTSRDPWVNMLRATVATLAAGVGGADAVSVLPFDHALGRPDAFARRIARNTSTILIEESHLARVIDPAGGSWYVERLTDELARAGWEFFQEIERAGGQATALRSGLVRDRLAATWSARKAKLAKRREPITGVSEFPFLAEKPVVREPASEPASDGTASAESTSGGPSSGGPSSGGLSSGGPSSGGLPRVRRDEDYEALRARSDAHLAATGARPRVFLAALGPAAAHTARLTFAANLFQAGGIEPVTEGTFARSGAREACLCSSDALYEERAGAEAAEMRAAGATHIFLAGRPGQYPEVDSYVFAGCDAVAVLTATLDRMGVS
ncbi:methylmalonyl-CoA mutase subunit beta [Streptomyces sp. NPDC093252]|uniref:methylmalonyl-CoA mutase subunit beta n=1 Tax=Streptomyces sp. NPDC093252 TaxID=3154980 RepID=UPI00343EB072